MPTGLKRLHNTGDLYLLTFSCHRQILGTPGSRSTFHFILDQMEGIGPSIDER